METITEAAAKRLGYKSISTDVNPKREPEIMASMERDLGPTGAVWIAGDNGRLQAARPVRDICQGEEELITDNQ